MMLCYGYNMKIKGTGKEIPDRAYETGKLSYGNGNPDAKNYASLTDFCYGDGKLELRIPWQLLNVMDPSSKQQMGDFWENQVITPQDYDSFSFGFGIKNGDNNAKINISGKYSYSKWNMPTWHERVKPAYYEVQKYLASIKSNEDSESEE